MTPFPMHTHLLPTLSTFAPRLCGGLVCHACSLDYKKQERRCPPCAQKGEAQAV